VSEGHARPNHRAHPGRHLRRVGRLALLIAIARRSACAGWIDCLDFAALCRLAMVPQGNRAAVPNPCPMHCTSDPRTGNPLLGDVQNARRIIANEGLTGLRRALASGKVALSAVFGLGLGLDAFSRQESDQGLGQRP
jgi:hypothetical protein